MNTDNNTSESNSFSYAIGLFCLLSIVSDVRAISTHADTEERSKSVVAGYVSTRIDSSLTIKILSL